MNILFPQNPIFFFFLLWWQEKQNYRQLKERGQSSECPNERGEGWSDVSLLFISKLKLEKFISFLLFKLFLSFPDHIHHCNIRHETYVVVFSSSLSYLQVFYSRTRQITWFWTWCCWCSSSASRPSGSFTVRDSLLSKQ